MSATFIEKIKGWIYYVNHTPISEHGYKAELIKTGAVLAVAGLIWLIGEIVYRWEGRR